MVSESGLNSRFRLVNNVISTSTYTCQLFLSKMREIFVSSWPGFPKTSEPLPKISEVLRMLPKMPEDIPTTFEHVNTIGTDCRHLKAFAIVTKGKK